MKTVYLSLGSNLGDRETNLERAVAALKAEGIRVLAKSSLYETEPQDVKDQPWFLNMAVCCETRLFPLQMIHLLLRLEREMGRKRTPGTRRGPRTIDIDILLFGQTVMNTPQLEIPHPRMLERRFVLEPLLEIAPEIRHPRTKELLRNFLPRLADQKLRKFIRAAP